MRRFFAVLTVLLIATASVPAAHAQGANGTEAQNATPSEADMNQVNVDLGNGVTLLGWHYDGDTMHVAVEASYPVPVSITDSYAGLDARGVSELPERETMVSGRETLHINTEEYHGESAVSVGAGRSFRVNTGMATFGNPFAGGNPTVGWLGGSVLAVGMFVGAGAYVLRQEGGAPKVADS